MVYSNPVEDIEASLEELSEKFAERVDQAERNYGEDR